jgi:hypothetical protein
MITVTVRESTEGELARETGVLGETLPQRHFGHHNPDDLSWDRSQAAEVTSRRLTA